MHKHYLYKLKTKQKTTTTTKLQPKKTKKRKKKPTKNLRIKQTLLFREGKMCCTINQSDLLYKKNVIVFIFI